MPTPRVLAAFCAGAVVSATVLAPAAPPRLAQYETFAQALALVRDRHAEPVDEERLLRDAIAGMLHARDAHSVYLPPARYQRAREDTEGELADIGVTLAPAPEGGEGLARPYSLAPVVAEVVSGSPAALAGVVAGDRVLAIDGVAAARDAAGAIKGWQRRLRGEAGTGVTLSLQRVGWRRPRDVRLVRVRRHVASARFTQRDELGVISIGSFTETTAQDTRAALASAAAARVPALILDLRGNLGGIVDQALAVADLFLESGTLATLVERERREPRVAHRGAFAAPVVVLVDGSTASAAELLAAALADNGRAKLVGEATYGKGTVQTVFPLSHGGALRLTTGWYLTPAGNRLESNGIQPDVKVSRGKWREHLSSAQTPGAGKENDAKIALGFDDDPQLVAAIAVARSLLGDANRGR